MTFMRELFRVNRLYYGDCLTIMQDMPNESVDFIYLDPPFNSDRSYNAIYTDETGRTLPDQVEAFNDMWELTSDRLRVIRNMPVLLREEGIDDDVAQFWRTWMQALRNTQPRLLAYLSYMVQRLLPMRRILKPSGSIYLHCDPTASHYIKVMMDGIFGHQNFRNDIAWRRAVSHNDPKKFGNIVDHILFYSRSEHHYWAGDEIATPKSDEDLDEAYPAMDGKGRYRTGDLTGAGTRNGESGRTWKSYDVYARGRHWAVPRTGRYAAYIEQHFIDGYRNIKSVHERLDALDEVGLIHHPTRGVWPGLKRYADADQGNPPQNLILEPIGFTNFNASHGEYLGFPTQKPVDLVSKFILASSPPGGVVMDPFAGCATTIEAAHQLGRQWIGIDIAIHAIKRVARVRLQQRLGLIEGEDFTIEGVPHTKEGARDLWQRDPYQFQKWAAEQADGFVTVKRTADGGIDGRLYFAVPEEQSLQSMVISVKGGKPNIADVRDLRGVLERDTALMAGLIVLDPPSERQAKNFEREMAAAGTLNILGIEYPRMQLLDVDSLLEGQRFHTPSVAGKDLLEPQLPGIPRQ